MRLSLWGLVVWFCGYLLDYAIRFGCDMAGAKGFNCKKLGRCGCVPQSGCPALVPTAAIVLMAPRSKRGKVGNLVWVAPWGLCVFVPRRHRPQPQGRTPKAGRPLARTASSKCPSLVESLIGLAGDQLPSFIFA